MKIPRDIAILFIVAGILGLTDARWQWWVVFGGLVALRLWLHRPQRAVRYQGDFERMC